MGQPRDGGGEARKRAWIDRAHIASKAADSCCPSAHPLQHRHSRACPENLLRFKRAVAGLRLTAIRLADSWDKPENDGGVGCVSGPAADNHQRHGAGFRVPLRGPVNDAV